MDRSVMDRESLCRAILSMDCDFPVDFTAEQLRSFSLERLRHVYQALCLHGRSGKGRRGTSAR